MARFQTACPNCHIPVWTNASKALLTGSRLEFPCPMCGPQWKTFDDVGIRLLREAGVPEVEPVPHPEPHEVAAPALTVDDVLSFVGDLRREDIVARVKAER